MKKLLFFFLTLFAISTFSVKLFAQAPTISSFSPLNAKPSDVVGIIGSNFNATPANNIVFFGATRATVTGATSTILFVTVPAGATYAPITVLNTGTSLAAYSRANFTPTYSPAKTAITVTDFAPKVDFTTGASPFSVAIGDLNGDGEPDMVVSNSGTNIVSVYQNTSSNGSISAGSFSAKVDFETGGFAVGVAIGDLDGDGKPDIAVSNFGSNNVSVLRNTSSTGSINASSFAAKVDFATGLGARSLAIGDLDSDGKPDLAVANERSDTVSVLRNTSTIGIISFAPKADFLTSDAPYSVAIGDLDGNGKSDIVVANSASSFVSVLRNTNTAAGTIAFALKVDYTVGSSPVSVAIGDLDGDGKPDLAVANYTASNVSVLRNTTTSGVIDANSFSTKVDFATAVNSHSVAIGDLDGDSKPDLAVSNLLSSSVSVLRNTASSGSITAGSFAAKVDFTTGSEPFSVAIADLDGDAKPDLGTANFGSNNVSVIRNADFLAPTNIALSTTTVNENVAVNTTIGSLTSTDPNAGNTFAYTLVSGSGSTDNASFNISANSLRITNSPDFETKSSYDIRIRTTDQGGLFFERQFTITVNDLNENPTNIVPTGTAVNENVATNTLVGPLFTNDPDAANTFTYTLVAGSGSTDNVFFNVSGNSLRIANSPDFETKSSYAIRIRTTDQGGLFFEKEFIITVNDINENPTNLFLSATAVNENVAMNTVVGALFPTDPDLANTFIYTLVSGAGSTDNASFNFNDDNLRINNSPNFESQSSYAIRIRTTDQGGLFFEKEFIITVNDVNENPTNLFLSATAVNENVATNTVVATFSSTDPDAANTYSYSLVSGAGSTDNASFNVNVNSLRINNSPDFETKSSYAIRIRTTDQGGLFFEKEFIITVNSVPDAPTASDQTLCFNGTVANLVAIGSNIKWYNVSMGGTALAPTTAVTATTYYASQTVGCCESTSRTAVVVTINNTIPAMPTASSPQVYVTGATVSSLTTSAVNPKWYTTATMGVALASNTTLVDGTTYYVGEATNACESARVAVVVRKISEASQALCGTPTIANLIATPSLGATASWFLAASGGIALSNSTLLTNGNYFVEQALGTTASSTTLHTALGSISDVAVQSDGKIVYADAINNLIRRMNADGTNHVTLSTAFNTPSGIAIDADGKILVTSIASTIGRINADGTNLVQLGSGFTFPEAVAIQSDGKILVVTGNDIKRMDADGTNIVTLGGGFFFPLAVAQQPDGKILVADSFNGVIKRMNADGTNIVELGSPNFITPVSIALQADGKILIADGDEIKRMNADGSSLETIFSGLQGTADIAVQADGKIIAGVNGNNSDFNIQRLTAANVSASNRVPVAVTVNVTAPPAASPQTFCKSATPADLVAIGTALKWYTAASGGVALASDADLSTANYFVTQTLNSCESERTEVAITVNTTVWNGTAWSNGTPDASKGAVFTGNYAQAANVVTCSVEVLGTAVVSVPSGFDFTVNSRIEVAPTASFVFENNANLLQDTGAVTIGNVVFKRNTTMQRLAYTNWSSPVANQNALAFSPQTVLARFVTYNEGTNAFNAVASPSTTNLIPGVGYGIRAPNNFADAPAAATTFVGTFRGIPNNGDYNFAATKVADGYNLIGNPYPSTMLASQFFIENSAVSALYFWNNTVLNAPAGHNFAAKTRLTSVRATADINSIKVPTDFIGMGQGFFIQVSSATNVVFTNAMRSSENNPMFFRNAISDKSLFKLNLLSANNTFNQIAIGYMAGATNGFDNQIDAVPFAQSPTMVSSLINNNDYVIQGRSLPFANTDVVPLGFKTDVAGNYSFTTEAFEGVFANNQNIFLKDNLAGITHNIKQSPYQFTSNVGTFNSRFEIVYVNGVLGIENPNFNENNVFVFVKNDNININSGNINMKNIQVFDIRGRLVFDKKEVNATQFEIENLKVEQAVLIVKISSEDGAIVSKKIVY